MPDLIPCLNSWGTIRRFMSVAKRFLGLVVIALEIIKRLIDLTK